VMAHTAWQIDPGAWLLRFLERVGLVWNLSVPSPEQLSTRRLRLQSPKARASGTEVEPQEETADVH